MAITLEATGFRAQKGHFQVFIFYIMPWLSPLLRTVWSLQILKSRIMFFTAALQVIKDLAQTLISHLPSSSLPKQFLQLLHDVYVKQHLLRYQRKLPNRKKPVKLISSFAESTVLNSLSEALLTWLIVCFCT